MLKIITTVAVIMTLVLADGPVLQTGQIKSYVEDGSVVPYGSIKDDGYYRAGVVRGYSRSGDVVIDNVTGLQWQDDVASIEKPWVDSGGDTAAYYCSTRFLGGHADWRLPKIEELQTLVDYSQYNPSITEGVFSHLFSLGYWSSTTNDARAGYAWGVNFSNGGLHYESKAYGSYVRCVRGGHLVLFYLSRNDLTEIVTDAVTGLQWQDDWRVVVGARTWTAAIDFCENTLVLGGYNDWRLPNLNELFSIVKYSQHDPAIDTSVFVNVTSDKYGSSTSIVDYTFGAWQVDFLDGHTTRDNKSNGCFYVRCVRGGQVNIPINPSIIMYLLN